MTNIDSGFLDMIIISQQKMEAHFLKVLMLSLVKLVESVIVSLGPNHRVWSLEFCLFLVANLSLLF